MSYFLALECSLAEGSLALIEYDESQCKCLTLTKWLSHFNGQYLENSHSDRLPLEIKQIIESNNKKLSDIHFLAVGIGPGRWTGVRTAVSVIRSLSFCLNLPVYTVNSLRICAQPFLIQSKKVFVAVNGFKNKVYFGEFSSEQDREGDISLLNFSDWCKLMEQKQQLLNRQEIICISDLEDFYSLPEYLKTKNLFKKLYPDAFQLSQIVFKQKGLRTPKSWPQVHPFYLRDPFE